MYTDLCSHFPHCAISGNQYIQIAYIYDSNTIIGYPMKNRSNAEFLHVYQEIIDNLESQGLKPQYHWLDNEASKVYKAATNQQEIMYQFLPPGNKRANNAKCAIQT